MSNSTLPAHSHALRGESEEVEGPIVSAPRCQVPEFVPTRKEFR